MKYYLWLFCCAVFLPLVAHADIKINEVAWMGTANSQYSEWIELHNDGGTSVPLKDWKLYKTGDTLLFTLSKTISAGGYLLIERTTSSAPDAIADVADEEGPFGGSGLRNTGEDVVLKDATGKTIDSVLFASGWPAGDAKTKDTMQWSGSKWITAAGTPDAANTTAVVTVETPAPTVATPTVPSTTIQTTPVQENITPVEQTPPTSVTTAPPKPTEIIIPTNNTASPLVSPKPLATAEAATIFGSSTPKPLTTKKKSITSKTKSVAMADQSSDATALQDSEQVAADDTQKENNHTEIIIFGAVILIGTALFLLLQRFKAQEE